MCFPYEAHMTPFLPCWMYTLAVLMPHNGRAITDAERLEMFEGPFERMGISGWNNLGSLIVANPASCAKECLSISQCRSFDYGARWSATGYCFLSTATRATVPNGDYTFWANYDYYERKEVVGDSMVDTNKAVSGFLGPFEHMGITGYNDLTWSRVSSPADCASMCSSLAACMSFDYRARGDQKGECITSTANRKIAGAAYESWHLYDYYERDFQSIMDNITGQPTLTTLTAALAKAGFESILNSPGPITVFAPDDAAFNQFGLSLQDIPDTPSPSFTIKPKTGRVNAGCAVDLEVSKSECKSAAASLGLPWTGTKYADGNIHGCQEGVGGWGDQVFWNSRYGKDWGYQVCKEAASELAPSPESLQKRKNLIDTLKFHVVVGSIASNDLSDGEQLLTELGVPLTVSERNDGTLFVGSAEVKKADIRCSNGVIHVIGNVLQPPNSDLTAGSDKSTVAPGTIMDILSSTPYNTLRSAIIQAGFDGTLNSSGAWTIFAPTDAAFSAFGAAAGLSSQQLLSSPDLPDILGAHVVNGSITTDDVGNATVLESVAGVPLSVSVAPGAVLVYAGDVMSFMAPFDIMATNGVVHVIDRVLTSTRSSSTTRAASSENSSQIFVGSSTTRAEASLNSSQQLAIRSTAGGAVIDSINGDGQVGTTPQVNLSGNSEDTESVFSLSTTPYQDAASIDAPPSTALPSEQDESSTMLFLLLGAAGVIVVLLAIVVVLLYRVWCARRAANSTSSSTSIVLGRPVGADAKNPAKDCVADGTPENEAMGA